MTADVPTIPRRPPIDRPWRRRLIAFALAVGIHAVVLAIAWPFVRDWVNTGGYDNPALTGPARSGPVTRQDVERAMAESPIITGLIGSLPTATEVVGNEEYASSAWSDSSRVALEHTTLPFAPRPWLALAPPVATLSFDAAPAKSSSTSR